MELQINDEEICRLCLQGNDRTLISIFDDDGTNVERILFCAKVKIYKNDGHPSRMCSECSAKLETAYFFRMQIECSDHQLRQKHKLSRPPAEANLNCSSSPPPNFETVDVNKTIIETDCVQQQQRTDDASSPSVFQLLMPPSTTEHLPNTTTGSKSFQCTKCNKSFRRSGQLKVHHRTHSGEKPYECDQCGSLFSMRHHLSTHQRIHSAQKPYKCSTCSVCFADQSSLNRHRKIHTGDRRHTCPTCSRSFIRAADLLKHSVCHTGEKPFECSVCHLRYSHESSLCKHRRQTHTKLNK